MTVLHIKLVNFCGSILLPFLFFAAVSAQEKTDVVVMKNGDRITCEIKGLEAGVLYLSLDYVDGTVAVQWSKVARIESSRLFIVKTEDGSVLKGKISSVEVSADAPLKIEVGDTPDKKAEIGNQTVVSMDPTSKSFWRRFNGDISAGMIYSKGNQSTQYNLRTAIEYPGHRWSFGGSFDSALSASSGTTASERNQLELGVRRLSGKKNYFYSGFGNFLTSSEQGINLQTSIGGGIGHYFKNSNRARIALVGGVAWQRTAYDGSTVAASTENATAALVATEIRLFRFKKMNLNITAAVLPLMSEPGRIYFKTNQSLYIKIYGNLSWNISLYGNWDNRPPAGLAGSDFGTSGGLGWTFGNR